MLFFLWVVGSLVEEPTPKKGALIVVWLLGYKVCLSSWIGNLLPFGGICNPTMIEWLVVLAQGHQQLGFRFHVSPGRMD